MSPVNLVDAVKLRRSLSVPDAGKAALHRPRDSRHLDSVSAEDIRDRIADGLDVALTRVWTSALVVELLQRPTLAESFALTLSPRMTATLPVPEVWLVDGGIPFGSGGEELTLDGLLVIRTDKARYPELDAGLLIAALIGGSPQIACWWPEAVPLGVILQQSARHGVPPLPLLVAGTWAGAGCFLCAEDALVRTETTCDGLALTVVDFPPPVVMAPEPDRPQ